MYETYFSLKEAPFSLKADANYFVNLQSHLEALKILLLGLAHAEGFMKITGEVGSGKTFLCNKLRKTLNGRYVTIYFNTPCSNEMDLFYNLARVLKFESYRDFPKHRLIEKIASIFLQMKSEGKRVLFLVDEAQAMDESALEALRLMNYYHSDSEGLFDAILFGQPELDFKLAHPMLRSLSQRMVFSYELEPLNLKGLLHYVRTRLRIAGFFGKLPFSPAALLYLYKKSQGVPRVVNILCHKALLAAYRDKKRQADFQCMREAVNTSPQPPSFFRKKSFSKKLLWNGAAIALGGIGVYLSPLVSTGF
jgi:MSHA biogenesis protein MshM